MGRTTIRRGILLPTGLLLDLLSIDAGLGNGDCAGLDAVPACPPQNAILANASSPPKACGISVRKTGRDRGGRLEPFLGEPWRGDAWTAGANADGSVASLRCLNILDGRSPHLCQLVRAAALP
jgi:hypothetical protein